MTSLLVSLCLLAADAGALLSRSEQQTLLAEAKKVAFKDKDYAKALGLYEDAWKRGARTTAFAFDGAVVAVQLQKKPEGAAWVSRLVDETGYAQLDVLSGPMFSALKGEPRYDALVARLKAAAEKRALLAGVGLTRTTPEAAGLDPKALEALLAKAATNETAAIVLLKNGKLVGEWHFGRVSTPLETMSATKSVVALAFVALLDDGKIPSLDTPVFTWFPEWKQGKKKAITVRQLLDHSSGLQADRNTQEIYSSPDFVKLALAAELVSDPGSEFFYNNKAVNLLPAIVVAASGKPIDVYLRERLFGPMGITDFEWSKDSAGNLHGMSGLSLHPADLAKLGQLVLDGGRWNGKALLSEARLKEFLAAGPFRDDYGLLWWRTFIRTDYELEKATLPKLVAAGFKPELAKKLAGVVGKPMPYEAYAAAVKKQIGEGGYQQLDKAFEVSRAKLKKHWIGAMQSYEAQGYLGQLLEVFPEQQLVAVRMSSPATMGQPSPEIDFDAFATMARALVR